MFDGIKIKDVAVTVDSNGVPTLLNNDRLTFGALVDPLNGFILDPIRRAVNRGLTFRLIPRRNSQECRVEVKGSLHKFHNNGQHNADQFTANNLLLTVNELVMDYGFDPFSSVINNIEFGVNIVLPFPVDHVLQNLVSYKNRAFTRDTHSQTPYYECVFQQFTVKLYDKGKQRGLDDDLLRVEIKVTKMGYFKNTGVRLNALVDLLNVTNYEPLGKLLMDTFGKILFDDPTIDTNRLTPRERDIYKNGRNPRYWYIPKGLTPKLADAHRQRLHRAERRYRTLFDQHGRGGWQTKTAALIGQTWAQLTTVDDHLLTRINERRAVWKVGEKVVREEVNSSERAARNTPANCHKLTDSVTSVCGSLAVNQAGGNCHKLTDLSEPAMSQITPLYSGVQRDTDKTPVNPESAHKPGRSVCPVTGVPITSTLTAGPDHERQGVRRFVSAAMLRNDDDLLIQLNSRFGQYGKGSQEDDYSRVAHNVRNTHSNPRNNLRRKLHRAIYGRDDQQGSLFPIADMIRLTDDERQTLAYWKGTRFEIPI